MKSLSKIESALTDEQRGGERECEVERGSKRVGEREREREEASMCDFAFKPKSEREWPVAAFLPPFSTGVKTW